MRPLSARIATIAVALWVAALPASTSQDVSLVRMSLDDLLDVVGWAFCPR